MSGSHSHRGSDGIRAELRDGDTDQLQRAALIRRVVDCMATTKLAGTAIALNLREINSLRVTWCVSSRRKNGRNFSRFHLTISENRDILVKLQRLLQLYRITPSERGVVERAVGEVCTGTRQHDASADGSCMQYKPGSRQHVQLALQQNVA